MEPYITINGKPFPFPKRGMGVQVATVVNSGRATDGRIIAQRIGRDQQKLNNCVWPVLPAKVWSEMLQELEKFDLTVSYPDPVTNTWTTRRMYPGDRSAEPYFVGTNGIPTLYINCTCNLIDRGEDGT